MYYKIRNTLEAIRAEEIFDGEECYVAVVSPEEWTRDKEKFNMGIDLEFEIENLFMTKAEVNYDSLTGSFIIPDRSDLLESSNRFAFALDERGIVFIDHDGYAASLVKRIAATKKWRYPGLERFIYDFLETIISGDLNMLERYEDEITIIEDRILEGNLTGELERNNEIRGELLKLKMYYEQLIDLGQELAENENDFFMSDNLRFFELFTARVTRLQGLVSTLKEYTMQVRELYQSELSVKQNRIMTVLTVVTTIIMPLTLVTGWYGMNFKYMPELDSPLAYPIVIGVVILMAVSGIIYFKKKKWL
ncbi:magnesium transporter CorA family protein [Catonella massiliensis]|jgi:hypothetical protein|uniref:Magnesium transporter CorA n=1 Tax=Catonella massiliensis TaxID=2799636 RepID=A0ABS1J239_9FIRM|nr:CorA family divalent cation transporter [Catonella massiliensis]MBK5897959.1 magnesium transporter CorA [Catonella massiliensis]